MSMWADGVQKKEVPGTTKKSRFASIVDQKLASLKADGGVDSKGRKLASKDNMFDSKGQLNAYDRKDAFRQIDRFASEKGRVSRETAKASTLYTPAEQAEIIKAALGDPAEKARFAADMIPLILERLDYEGFGRQVLMTHEVGQGQIISYERDIFPTALVVNSDGKGISTVIKGDREFIPEFTISSFPKVSMQEVATRQFDVIDRLHEKAFREIQKQEDRNISRLLYQGSTMENTQLAYAGNIDKVIIENLAKKVENHQLLVDKIIMHRDDFSGLRITTNSMDLDPVTSLDVLRTGIFANMYGYKIMVTAGQDEQGKINQTVPKGVLFAVTDGRYLGAMPIRQELMVMNADQFVNNELAYGWAYGEIIGQSILNYRSVACAVKSGATIPSWIA